MFLNISVNSVLFHTFETKDAKDRERLSAIISASKYTIWKLNSTNTDPDLPDKIIWLKFVTNAVWMADTQISQYYDYDFWSKFKFHIKEWDVVRQNSDSWVNLRLN